MLRYGIANSHRRSERPVTVAANAVFNRNMKEMYRIADDARTFILEDTVFTWWDPFSNAKRLRTVVFDKGLRASGDNSGGISGTGRQGIDRFCNCGIRHIRLPATLIELSNNTFKYCAELRQITLPEGLRKIGGDCFSNAGLREIEIPKSVIRIGSFAFYNCKGLRSVTFQEGSRLDSIGESAFSHTRIEEFVAPNSLKQT